jgi:hypothetical protein
MKNVTIGFACAIFIAAAGSAIAGSKPHFHGAPATELEFVSRYGNIAQHLAPGVYQLEDKGVVKTIAYGIDGMRYRLAEMEAMAKSEDGAATDKDSFGAMAADLRGRLQKLESPIAKASLPLPSDCAHDGVLDATYIGDLYTATVNASAGAALDGFGPFPEGDSYVSTTVKKRVRINGVWRWMTTGQTTREVASTSPVLTIAADSVFVARSATCASVWGIAQFTSPDYPESLCYSLSITASGACN